jgi:ADP-ribosyl-[dinitrogen reductase] hydrolase
LGGDTDTNACIVGGMMGALLGKNGIPEEMKDKVLNCDVRRGGQPNRPKFLQVKVLFETAM